MEVVITSSNRPDKRLQAKFENKTVHFGSKDGRTFIDHKDRKVKDAWIARHKVRENWGDYRTAGSLAKNILWNKRSIKASIDDLNKRQKQYKFTFKTQ